MTPVPTRPEASVSVSRCSMQTSSTSDHLATLQYTTSPEHFDKVNIYTLGYRIPLYSLGDSIDLYGGYSDVDSGTVQSGVLSLNVSGKGAFAGVRYNQNLTVSVHNEHRVLYGFDYGASRTTSTTPASRLAPLPRPCRSASAMRAAAHSAGGASSADG